MMPSARKAEGKSVGMKLYFGRLTLVLLCLGPFSVQAPLFLA